MSQGKRIMRNNLCKAVGAHNYQPTPGAEGFTPRLDKLGDTLELELAGEKSWVGEYKTTEGEILTDLDIACLNGEVKQ